MVLIVCVSSLIGEVVVALSSLSLSLTFLLNSPLELVADTLPFISCSAVQFTTYEQLKKVSKRITPFTSLTLSLVVYSARVERIGYPETTR